MTIAEFINKVGFKVKQDDVKKVNDTISGIKDTAAKLLGAIGIGFSLVNLKEISEEFNGINDKINFAVKGLANQKEAQQAILKAANDTKSSYEAMAGTVTNLVKAGSDLFSVDEAVAFSSAVSKLLKTAGRGEGEIQSVMDGLNKSFQKGVVEAETLNVMLEQCPEAANLLADKLGVAKTGLLDMAANGQISCTQLKEAFLSSASEIDTAFSNLDFSISDAMLNIRNKWGYYVDELNSTLGITKTIAKTMVSGFNQVMGVLNKVRNGVVWLSEKLGGAENLMKLVALAAGSIFIAMNFSKITSGLSSVLKLLSSIKLSTVAIAGAFVLAALLVEDFISFMQGNDSLLGAMLQKAGIDCDALREKIRKTWDNIKKIFQVAGNAIKNIASAIFAAIGKVWEQYGGIITNKIASFIESAVDNLNKFSEWLVEHKDTVIKFGGVISGLAGSFFAVKKGIQIFEGIKATVKKLIPVFSTVKGVVSKAGAAFKLLSGPVGIAVAAISAILAISYDFFNFMKGKDSVIGKIFDKMGVDSDAVRQKVTDAWEKVKSVLLSVWNVIKTAAEEIWGGLKAFWDKHGEQIKRSFENIWTGIKNIIISVWSVIKTVAETVFNALKAFWDTWGETIITTFKGIWDVIKAVFGTVFDILADIFAIFSDLFSGNWSQLWEDVKQLFSDIWNGIVNILTTVIETIWNVLSSIFSKIGEFLSGIWEAVKGAVGNIKNSIVEGFTNAVEWIKSLPSKALEWGKDIIMGIVDGIKGAASAVGDAVKDVADKIKSFLGFSEPEDGPLSDFHTYMPDMIDLMANGIRAGKSKISDAVKALAGNMSVGIKANADDLSILAKSGIASGETLATVAGQSNISKSIVQNVEINNEFHGDRAGQQKSAEAMDNASDDCTSELARALAYTR